MSKSEALQQLREAEAARLKLYSSGLRYRNPEHFPRFAKANKRLAHAKAVYRRVVKRQEVAS